MSEVQGLYILSPFVSLITHGLWQDLLLKSTDRDGDRPPLLSFSPCAPRAIGLENPHLSSWTEGDSAFQIVYIPFNTHQMLIVWSISEVHQCTKEAKFPAPVELTIQGLRSRDRWH